MWRHILPGTKQQQAVFRAKDESITDSGPTKKAWPGKHLQNKADKLIRNGCLGALETKHSDVVSTTSRLKRVAIRYSWLLHDGSPFRFFL